jgi:hypothetical protein
MATPGGGTGDGAAWDAATESDRRPGVEPVEGELLGGAVGDEPVAGEPVVGEPMVAEPLVGEPVVGEPVLGEPVVGEPLAGEPERLLGRVELAQVLRFVQAGYRIAATVFGALSVTSLLLGLLVWTVQGWTWPAEGDGAPWLGMLLLVVLLLPAGAFWWTRRRCRRGAAVGPAALEADLMTYRRSAVGGITDLADATRRRAGESGWRRPARIARRAFRLRDLIDPEATAIRSVLGPFAPGAVPLLWFGAFGTVALLIVGLPLAIAS